MCTGGWATSPSVSTPWSSPLIHLTFGWVRLSLVPSSCPLCFALSLHVSDVKSCSHTTMDRISPDEPLQRLSHSDLTRWDLSTGAVCWQEVHTHIHTRTRTHSCACHMCTHQEVNSQRRQCAGNRCTHTEAHTHAHTPALARMRCWCAGNKVGSYGREYEIAHAHAGWHTHTYTVTYVLLRSSSSQAGFLTNRHKGCQTAAGQRKRRPTAAC